MYSCEDFAWSHGFGVVSGIVSQPACPDKTQSYVPQVPSPRDTPSSSGSSPSFLGRYSQKSPTDVHNRTRRMTERFLWAWFPPRALASPIHNPNDVIIKELM